jgi:hypothetical protein
MGYFIALLVIVGVFFYMNIKRGRRFVQAYVFINHYEYDIEEGMDREKAMNNANRIAIEMTFSKYSDPVLDRQELLSAKQYAANLFGGKQLPVIAKAKSMGFLG